MRAITRSQWRSRKRGVTWDTKTQVEHQARCCVLDAFYGFYCRGQERVALVEASDGEHLDQDLCCFKCEEGPDPAYVVEGNSTRSGHRGNVGVAAQLAVQYHAKVPYRP